MWTTRQQLEQFASKQEKTVKGPLLAEINAAQNNVFLFLDVSTMFNRLCISYLLINFLKSSGESLSEGDITQLQSSLPGAKEDV